MITPPQTPVNNKFSKLIMWQQKKDWQDKVFFCSLLFFFLFYLFLFSKFHQFPSEYYGGDQYAHFGSALKIYDTLNPFLSSHYYNELQHYPWLVPFLIAMLAKVLFQDPFQVAIYFPVLILIATMLITYIFGKRYFENKTWALILTLSWAVQLVPSFHPSEFAKQLMIPLLCLFALLLYSKEGALSKKRVFVAGIIYGLAGLEHIVTFFVASVLFLFVVLFQGIERKTDFWKYDLKRYFAVLLIGWAIAALFWAPLFIKYHGKTMNNWQEYTSQTILPGADIVSAMFVESMKYGNGVMSWIALEVMIFGFCFAIKRKDRRIFIPVLLIAAGLLGIIHPYITYPFFHMTLGYYRFPIVFVFVKQVLLVWGLYALVQSLPEKILSKKYIFLCAALIVLVWVGSSFYFLMQNYIESERYGYALQVDERIEAYRGLRAFIEKQHLIEENEVTLVLHQDLGFFFNAMTGKNVMLTRVTHATPFVDHNQRAADMAVLLYGNDFKKAKEIIEEYHLAYLFSEVGNIQFRRLCLKHWNETVYNEKKDKTVYAYWCIETDPQYQEYLNQYGIETTIAPVRLASGDSDVPLINVLVVKPEEVKLDLQEVYNYEGGNNKTILKLYRILGPKQENKGAQE
ncbi:hypothetical protein HZA99_04480 [Candidatus Woesearchaeota archaeon]|nr:hypothetical protein [Candidatus Woesearchaeota archaeon]